MIQETRQTIMDIVKNKYVFSEFWRHHNGESGAANWEIKLNDSIKHAESQFERCDTAGILTTLFDRLYVLRNQLVHGGATWNSNANRSQVKDGARIMGFLVPVFINLMMDNHKMFCGKPYYPLVGYPPGADG